MKQHGALWKVLAAIATVLPMMSMAKTASADTIASKRAEAARLSAQIQALGNRVSQLDEAYDQAVLAEQHVDAQVTAAQAALARTDHQLGSDRARVRDLAISTYMRGGTAADLELFVPHTADELDTRNAYVSTVVGNTSDAIDALHAVHLELGAEQAQLADAQAAATRAVAAADSARRSAAAADASARGALAHVQGQLAVLVAQDQAARQAAEIARVQSRYGGWSGGASFTGPLPPLPPGAAGAVEEARRQLGKPYVWGGGGPDSFDCSGLTAWAWGHVGVSLPHSAAAQYDVTTHIPISALLPGDLVFYGSPPHHVGIYVGGSTMIDALHSGTNVEYDSIYLEGDLIGGGRVS